MSILSEDSIALHDKVAPYRKIFQRGNTLLEQAMAATDEALRLANAEGSGMGPEDVAFIRLAAIDTIDAAVVALNEKKAELSEDV